MRSESTLDVPVDRPPGGAAVRRSRRPVERERLALGTLSVVAVLVLWEIAARSGWISELFFSSPLRIVATAPREFSDPQFGLDVLSSAYTFGVGYVSAAALAILAGLVIGASDFLRYATEPWLTFFYALPRIALIPVILLWTGIGITTVTLVVFLGVFFTVILHVVEGASLVDPKLRRVSTAYGATRWKVFSGLVLPSSVPFILTGLRLGVARGLIGVVIGELFAGTHGLGKFIQSMSTSLQTERALFAVCLLIVLGLVSVELLRKLEKRFSTWRNDLSVDV